MRLQKVYCLLDVQKFLNIVEEDHYELHKTTEKFMQKEDDWAELIHSITNAPESPQAMGSIMSPGLFDREKVVVKEIAGNPNRWKWACKGSWQPDQGQLHHTCSVQGTDQRLSSQALLLWHWRYLSCLPKGLNQRNFNMGLAEQPEKTAEATMLSFTSFVFIFLDFVLSGVGMWECPDNFSYSSW